MYGSWSVSSPACLTDSPTLPLQDGFLVTCSRPTGTLGPASPSLWRSPSPSTQVSSQGTPTCPLPSTRTGSLGMGVKRAEVKEAAAWPSPSWQGLRVWDWWPKRDKILLTLLQVPRTSQSRGILGGTTCPPEARAGPREGEGHVPAPGRAPRPHFALGLAYSTVLLGPFLRQCTFGESLAFEPLPMAVRGKMS